MSYEPHKEEHKGLIIRILHDEDAASPDDWDSIGTIYTKHNRYFAIGEDLNKIDEDPRAYEDTVKAGGESLPIFAYVHSGVALSTGAFGCPWDSGQCGFIALPLEKIISEYGDDSEASREKARKYMKCEVENWNSYVGGNIYGFIVEDKKGNELDSCWGFYGDYDADGGALSEARSVADYHAKQIKAKHEDRLKAKIRNRAPLTARGGEA